MKFVFQIPLLVLSAGQWWRLPIIFHAFSRVRSQLLEGCHLPKCLSLEEVLQASLLLEQPRIWGQLSESLTPGTAQNAFATRSQAVQMLSLCALSVYAHFKAASVSNGLRSTEGSVTSSLGPQCSMVPRSAVHLTFTLLCNCAHIIVTIQESCGGASEVSRC